MDNQTETISSLNLRFHIYRENWSHTNVKRIESENLHLLKLSVSVEPSNWYWSRRFRNVPFYPFRQANETSILPLTSLLGQALQVANLAEIPFPYGSLKDIRSSKETNSQSCDLIQHLVVERGFFYQFS